MRVTFLICNYNYGEWLGGSIGSVFSQTYPHDKIRICVVDDSSTDDSVDIAKRLLEIRESYDFGPDVVHKGKAGDIETYLVCKSKNEGPSAARNLGIERTLHDTDAYLILDADDEAMPYKAEQLVKVMQEAKNYIGVVYADYINHNVDTNLGFIEYKEPFSVKRLLQECIVHSGSLINKQALIDTKDENGFYDVNMRTCEDYDLWLRIAKGWAIVHVPQVLTFVRVTDKNSTSTVSKEIWQKNWQRIREKIHNTSKKD